MAISSSGISVAGISASSGFTSENIDPDRWHQPLSNPTYRRFSYAAAMFAAPIVPPIAPFPETVTEDRWHQPLSEPVRFKRALPVAQHPASFMVGAAPFLESVISYCTAEGGVMGSACRVTSRSAPANAAASYTADIDPAMLRVDDFEGFFARRRESLLTLIEQAMGKPIDRGQPAGEEVQEESLLEEAA